MAAVAPNLKTQLLKNLDNLETYITYNGCLAVNLLTCQEKIVECPFGEYSTIRKLDLAGLSTASDPKQITGNSAAELRHASDDDSQVSSQDSNTLPSLPATPVTPARKSVTFKSPLSEVKGKNISFLKQHEVLLLK